MDLKKYIEDVPDFPNEGILFRDVTPLMQNAQAYKEAINQFCDIVKEKDVDLIVGPEARGFLFGCPVAVELEKGFVPVRKPGKLPRETVSKKYELEYGTNEIFMHKDSIQKGQKVFIIDDLLATGGTINATASLIEEMGGEVVGMAFLIELEGLKGRDELKGYDVYSLLKY